MAMSKKVTMDEYLALTTNIFAQQLKNNTTVYFDGLTNEVCPVCGTKIYFSGTMSHHEVHCQTLNCFKGTLRGL